jgi:pSer/pThr/pTyr-binding forkhead associated (FHA) protein
LDQHGNVPGDRKREMTRVVLVSVGPPERNIIVDELPAMIGRDAAADISLDDSWVGHFQCIIDREGDKLRVLDLGSRNGTFINGVRIRRATLMPGDTLTVGRTDFIVQYANDTIRDSGGRLLVAGYQPSRTTANAPQPIRSAYLG